MIIDLPRFIAAQRPVWTELEKLVERLERESSQPLSLDEAKHFHLLYQKVSADLGRVATFAAEPELRGYLEALTARAYAEIHETRERSKRFRPVRWFTHEFPRVFRRQFGAFAVSVVITVVGMIFGGFAVALDEEAKEAVLPGQFANHLGDPARRVAEEEKPRKKGEERGAMRSTFAGMLMANNISVSIRAVAFGMTWGIGTIILLFYNGVILGLVAVDYILAGQLVFLLGWLLPHGVIEIPAVLIAGQGGLVLGRALIGRGDRAPLRDRLRAVGGDVMTLIGGVAVMLVWAGIVESFLSQHHQPVVPYWLKILFGTLELAALIWFLAGRRGEEEEAG
jgi:uncharacterized membrane protein SpoIIM required for sporulation